MTTRKTFENRLSEILTRRPDVRAAMEDVRAQSKLPRALVRLRKAVGLTQRQLADKAGWKQPFLARVESLDIEAPIPDLATIANYALSCNASLGICLVRHDGEQHRLLEVIPLTDDPEASNYMESLGENRDEPLGLSEKITSDFNQERRKSA